MKKISMSSLLTFHEHPKKVGQMEIMQQNYKDDARCGVFLHWDLWKNSTGHTGWKKDSVFLPTKNFKHTGVYKNRRHYFKHPRIFNYGCLIFWA